jgi:hypothetical protein
MKDTCHRSPFGTMFAPSTDTPGKELLTWFLAGFPARTSAPPGRETGLTGNGLDCGWKWHESSVKYDLALRLWKTRQCSLLGDSEPYSETWPRSGTMRNGECWERQMWARITRETGSGFWPTVTVCGNYNRKGLSKNSGDGLATAVASWPTPTKSDGSGGPGCSGRAGGLNLRTAVAKWPTPTASEDHYRLQVNSQQSKSLGAMAARSGGPLNPEWVEWLMGWPLGWTDCKPLETDRCHSAMPRLGVG